MGDKIGCVSAPSSVTKDLLSVVAHERHDIQSWVHVEAMKYELKRTDCPRNMVRWVAPYGVKRAVGSRGGERRARSIAVRCQAAVLAICT